MITHAADIALQADRVITLADGGMAETVIRK